MERNLRDEREPVGRELDDTSDNESEREGIEDLGAGLTGGKNASPGMGSGGGLGSDIRNDYGNGGTGNSGPSAAEHRNDPDLEDDSTDTV